MKKIYYYIGGGGLALIIAGAVSFFILIKDIPSAELLATRQVFESTKIYDRTGEVLLYEIHGEEKRTIISFDEIPEHAKHATIAIEDENFYNHGAIDIKGIIRALLVNLSKGRIDQGGSTITQQLAKKAFLTDHRTPTRKIRELVLALKLEKKYSKDEILYLYLNQIPYGSNAYGIEAASKTFFNKKAKDLNLAEAALLAGLPKAPSYFSPYGMHVDELMDRKDITLDKMYELGFITEEERKEAQEYKFDFAPDYTSIKAPHFSIMVKDYLNNKYGEDFVRIAGLKVITTLDWKMQELAEKAVAEGAQRNKELYEGHNAALVAQDANTGQIMALVGSKDYFAHTEPENCTPGLDCRFEGNFNVAAQGLRQPGSAIKPFAYLAAFKKGYTPETVVFDLPTEFASDNPDCPLTVDFNNENKQCFHPRNFDDKFRGPTTLRQALSQSVNVSASKVLYLAGIDNLLKLVKEFGINTLTERSRYGLSLVLGGGEIKLIELVNAYSVLAQDGLRHKQTYILKISDDDKTLEEYSDDPVQAVEPQYARLVNDILSDVESRSALFSGSLPLTVFPNQEVAIKTGTTNDYRDAWTFAYTKSLVVGVWSGNNNNEPMHKHGSSILAAVPIMNAFMRETLIDRPTDTFNLPDQIFVEKPMLKGEYVVNYWENGIKYPQIHDILFYVTKNDPLGPSPSNPESDAQFKNWEEPVLNWARSNIPNFDLEFNKPVSERAEVRNENQGLTIEIIYPLNGSFLQNQTTLAADVKSNLNLKKFEIYFNNILIDSLFNISGNYSYRRSFQITNAENQNLIKIVAIDEANTKAEKEIIIYK